LKAIYSLCPGLRLEVRSCEDGVLVYDSTARTTHLIPPAAWGLFVSISKKPPEVMQHELDELNAATIPADGAGRLTMLHALERAGLIMRC